MARPPWLGARLGTPEQPPPAQAAKGMGGPPLTPRSYGLAASTLSAKRRTLERQRTGILGATSSCDLTRALQAKISRARDQLLTVLDHPGVVEATNNNSLWTDVRLQTSHRSGSRGHVTPAKNRQAAAG